MRKYPLHYINEDDFESLANLICVKILGEAVIPFAKGTDGGREERGTTCETKACHRSSTTKGTDGGWMEKAD